MSGYCGNIEDKHRMFTTRTLFLISDLVVGIRMIDCADGWPALPVIVKEN